MYKSIMSKINLKVSIFHQSHASLGEGLFVSKKAIYWLDINNCLLITKTYTGVVETISLPEQASSIWKIEKGVVYLASESGLCTLNLKTKKWEVITPMHNDFQNPLFRSNDGGEILNGKYLFGTMEKNPSSLSGSLYLIDGDEINVIFKGIGIPNSFIKKSEDELLISDSLCRKIYSFKFSSVTQQLISHDLWLDLRAFDYVPDGGCVDSNKNIYIAMWDGACVNKYDMNANLLASYSLPAIRPTNCKLSNDEKSLYVTTAKEGLSKDLLVRYPYSGSVLKIELD
jgi:sugar lactone lactonase YvrE